eukprot:51668-Eustigmatos_ZCMA.PRE.1
MENSEYRSLWREINKWMLSFGCKSYTRAVYSYSGKVAPNVFNSWTGFRVEQDMDISEPKEPIPVLDPWEPEAEDPTKCR